jgi:hypothetical protein
VKYGPEEHGNKNKLTNIHTKNAHQGEVTLSIISAIFGLQEKGTSITKNLPYQKKSLRLASHTRIHKIQTTNLRINVLLDQANAENNHIPIAK